ncbi:hypothetical protein GCM10010520_15380 [Rhizobium viscosum]|uniref:Uncharacterized protein n=1 Tax=Rhizobium viscosum TaxID=1673 RepID=A0ABR9IXI5_RHIVS|nr:hypothetical protein [Rhizobium viscosum]
MREQQTTLETFLSPASIEPRELVGLWKGRGIRSMVCSKISAGSASGLPQCLNGDDDEKSNYHHGNHP